MPEEMSKEAIKDYEKLAEENKKDVSGVFGEAYKKVLRKTAKILAATLPLPLLTACAACEKPPVLEEQQQEEEKGQEIVSSETKEETRETPPVVDETPEKIEWEGMIITPIEGLRFEKGTFFAEANNPYGLEVGEKAGVFGKDAVEINGVMESSIGLRPEVIEVMQKEIMETDKEFRFPLPFDLEQAKGIKIREVAYTSIDEWTKKDGSFWDNNFRMEISNVPLGTIIYSPISTSPDGYLLLENNPERRDDCYDLIFQTDSSLKGKLFRKMDRIDAGAICIDTIGIKPLPEGIEEKMSNEGPFPFYSSDVKMGTPVVEIISREYLNDKYWDKSISPSNPTNEPSILIYYEINQLKDADKPDIGFEDISKRLLMGLEGLLKLGEEEIFVFINPAHE